MFNIVAHEPGEVGAVLVRAVEPLEGIDIMKKNRGVEDKRITDLTNGHGKLTVAFGINKRLNGVDVTSWRSPIYVLDSHVQVKISSSKRIGVRADLEKNLRFYIQGNRFVSKTS